MDAPTTGPDALAFPPDVARRVIFEALPRECFGVVVTECGRASCASRGLRVTPFAVRWGLA